MQDFSGCVEQCKDFLDNKNGWYQYDHTQQNIEKNGLGRKLLDFFQPARSQVLRNNGWYGTTCLPQYPYEHGQKGTHNARRGQRLQTVRWNVAHYGRIRNGKQGLRYPWNGCRDSQLVDGPEIYLCAQIGCKLQHQFVTMKGMFALFGEEDIAQFLIAPLLIESLVAMILRKRI